VNIEAKPLSEITRRATEILFQKMGVVDTLRFLNQFSTGRGDYTKERDKWLASLTLDEAVSQIKAANFGRRPK